MSVSLRALQSSTIASLACALILSGCATARRAVVPSDLGASASLSSLEASLAKPGVVTFRRVSFAHWMAGRGTFIDREDVRTAGVPEGYEKATIYAYVIDHPRFGRVMVDSGVSADLNERLSWVMRRGVRDLDIDIERTTRLWLADEAPPKAVFLTHLHFDHIGGLIDLSPATPVYVGAGEAEERSRANLLLGRPAEAILRDFGPLREWTFQPDPDGAFEGVIDVFGDGSIWALKAPGHSAGSTAYLINAVDGPKLVVGDAVSTRLNWESHLPQPAPTALRARAEASADSLRRFAAGHPTLEVFLGHQSRPGQAEPR